jgi:hypothetical protein
VGVTSAAQQEVERCAVEGLVGREVDHADHRCGAGGVVHAGLALERRPRAPADLARPRTENITAGSVGAGAAPTRPDPPVDEDDRDPAESPE